MSLLDDNDSLHDGVLSSNILIPLEYNAISNTNDMFEDFQDDISSNLPQEGTTVSLSTSTSTFFEQYSNNTSIVSAHEKNSLTACCLFWCCCEFFIK